MQKYAKEVSVGVFVFIGLLCVGYLTIKLGKLDFFGPKGYTVSARFTSVAGLKSGAEVVISGIPVGRVSAVRLDQQRGSAVIDMFIRDDVTLTTDAIASVKTSGLIGDKYIRLSPGGAPDRLGNGDFVTETESAVDLEELISKYVFGGVK